MSLVSAGLPCGAGFSLLAAILRVGGGPLAEESGGEFMFAVSLAIVPIVRPC
ncbi:MAG TPA: hypothetical protein VL614_07990 [Acetobacteraceae bacterium]|jgi:hypothetical protein|nr:hypothetical protein [Acetobacteraceae bacterium]